MDIKIDQKAVIQQVLGMNPGKNIVIINMANTINECAENDKKTLWEVIQHLPEPRFENLKQMAIEECLKHIGNKTASASFLGLSLRTVRVKTNQEREIDVTPSNVLELNP